MVISITQLIVPPLFTTPTKKTLNKKWLYFKKNKKFDKPIIITNENIIINGFANYVVAKRMGLEYIDCFYYSFLTQNKIREIIFDECEGYCSICGKELQNDDYKDINTYMTIDHIQPISKGGLNILANMQGSCAKCNVQKGNTYL